MRFEESATSFESPCARSQRSTINSKLSVRWEMELQELEQHEDDIWQTIDQLKAAYSGVRKEAWRTI